MSENYNQTLLYAIVEIICGDRYGYNEGSSEQYKKLIIEISNFLMENPDKVVIVSASEIDDIVINFISSQRYMIDEIWSTSDFVLDESLFTKMIADRISVDTGRILECEVFFEVKDTSEIFISTKKDILNSNDRNTLTGKSLTDRQMGLIKHRSLIIEEFVRKDYVKIILSRFGIKDLSLRDQYLILATLPDSVLALIESELISESEGLHDYKIVDSPLPDKRISHIGDVVSDISILRKFREGLDSCHKNIR